MNVSEINVFHRRIMKDIKNENTFLIENINFFLVRTDKDNIVLMINEKIL